VLVNRCPCLVLEQWLCVSESSPVRSTRAVVFVSESMSVHCTRVVAVSLWIEFRALY
jgi:hypothetical protein